MKQISDGLLFFRRDLGLQLFLVYLLFVGPLLIGGLVVNDLAGDRLRGEVEQADQNLANALSQELTSYINDLIETVDQLAHHPSIINADPAGIEELFRTITIGRANISVIYFLDQSCQLQYHFRPGIGYYQGGNLKIFSNELCQRDINVVDAIVLPGHISRISTQPVITIINPVFSLIKPELSGWIAIDVRLNSLNEIALRAVQHRPDEGFEARVIDGSGNIIARSDFNPRAILIDAKADIPGLSETDPPGLSWISADENDTELLLSASNLELLDWLVIVNRQTENAFLTSQAFNSGLGVAVFLFILVGFLFWIMLSNWVLNPLEKLAIHSQKIAQENHPEIGQSNLVANIQSDTLISLSKRPDQIGRLVRSLGRAEEVLAARFNELETLLKTGAAVVSSLELRTVLDRILEQVEQLLGVEKSAIIALDEQHGVFRSQASRGLSQRYTEQIIIHPGEPVSITLRALDLGKPLQISDIETDENRALILPRAREEGLRAMLAIPLSTFHAPPTALLVYHSEPHEFTTSELNLLQNFAHQATMAIENATLFKLSDQQFQEQTRRLEALIHSMRDGLIVEDLYGLVLYVNRMTEELTGLNREQVQGRSSTEIIDKLLEKTRNPRRTKQALKNTIGRNENRQVDIEYKQSPGHLRHLRMRIFDVTDNNGVLIGRGIILHDITRRREIDRMRSSLVSTVSHELRTPLASIKGYATTLLSDDVEWDAISQREFLTIISQETDRLTELVKDLLDMSRIEAGNLSISRIECNLVDLVSRAAQRTRQSPNGRLQINIPTHIPDLYLDPQRIEVVFRNLIENAVKYSDETSVIEVTAEHNNGEVVIRVQDEGMGIPAAEQERIFESFYQVENGLTRTNAGAGLGLAICQGFIQAHGGKIWYESRDKGSCFAFSLPTNIKADNTLP